MVDTQETIRARKDWKEPQWLMPLIDTILAIIAFGLAFVLRYDFQLFRPLDEANRSTFPPYIPYAVVYIAWMYLNFRNSGLYRVVRGRSWIDEVYTIINGVANATVITLALSFALQPLVFSRLMMIYVGAITII